MSIYLFFTIEDSIENTSGRAVTLYPFGLISRHGTPQVAGFFILHEGLIGVMGEEGLHETNYKSIDEKKLQQWSATNTCSALLINIWAAAFIADAKAKVDARYSTDASAF